MNAQRRKRLKTNKWNIIRTNETSKMENEWLKMDKRIIKELSVKHTNEGLKRTNQWLESHK